jgi:DNA-binding transcriptional ArsR family regulator
VRNNLTFWLNTDDAMVDRLTPTFAALADPTRRKILARLMAGVTTVNALAAPHDISLPAISKHLKVLERSGLITRLRDAQTRPCRLHAAPLKEAVDWLEGYRRHWEESFDRLDELLQEMQAADSAALQARERKPRRRVQNHGHRPSNQ